MGEPTSTTALDRERPLHSCPEQVGSPSFRLFLQKFLDAGYEFTDFEGITTGDHKVVMHHDVDGDPHFALKAAEIEAEMGIQAHYFFMTHSEMYNLGSYAGLLWEIEDLGHTVSLHYSTSPCLFDQRVVFSNAFKGGIGIVSIHKPKFPIHLKLTHTYEDRYFKDVEYVSDSQCKWKYGDPFSREAFKKGENMHVLTHPTWWFFNSVEEFADYKAEQAGKLVLEENDIS